MPLVLETFNLLLMTFKIFVHLTHNGSVSISVEIVDLLSIGSIKIRISLSTSRDKAESSTWVSLDSNNLALSMQIALNVGILECNAGDNLLTILALVENGKVILVTN